jgi:hypothetical protein
MTRVTSGAKRHPLSSGNIRSGLTKYSPGRWQAHWDKVRGPLPATRERPHASARGVEADECVPAQRHYLTVEMPRPQRGSRTASAWDAIRSWVQATGAQKKPGHRSDRASRVRQAASAGQRLPRLTAIIGSADAPIQAQKPQKVLVDVAGGCRPQHNRARPSAFNGDPQSPPESTRVASASCGSDCLIRCTQFFACESLQACREVSLSSG